MLAMFLAIVLGLGLAAAIIVPAVMWRGFVLSVIWGWLVVPLFGFAPLSLVAAITLSSVAAFLTMQAYTGPDDPEKTSFLSRLEIIFLHPLITLALAFILKQFI